MRDMLKDQLPHTPERNVDRVATTPLPESRLSICIRQQKYKKILAMVNDPRIKPLSSWEAEEYLDSIVGTPLLPNTMFPPDDLIVARSIKTTQQYAYIHPSKICKGRGLWLRPGVEIPKGTFMGFYIGWVTDTKDSTIWDMEDLDGSYVLGIPGFITHDLDGSFTQTNVHANDRMDPTSQEIFSLACANEWIWQEVDGTHSDPNSLRFGKRGMVFANRHMRSSASKLELTIGLGREGLPFTGWTNYKKTLMGRLLNVITTIVTEVLPLNTWLLLEWRQALDDMRDIIEVLRYDTLPLLRDDRSAIAILLAGVENENDIDHTITIEYDMTMSMMDNLRSMVQHAEIRKRCNFRYADRPQHSSTSSIGTLKFWSKILENETKKKKPELKGYRRSQRIVPQSFSENNVLVLVDSAGHRKHLSTIPLALVPDGAGNISQGVVEPHSLCIYQGQECVVSTAPCLESARCAVRFEDGSAQVVEIKDLTTPDATDFLDARWTIPKTDKKLKTILKEDNPSKLDAPLMYGDDYQILDELLHMEEGIGGQQGIDMMVKAAGTTLQLPLDNTLRVATWNSSGLKTMRKLHLAVELMQLAQLDILCIQDTRIEPGLWAEELVRQAKDLLGPGASVFLAPVSARAPGSSGANVGGQLILKSPRAGVTTNFWCDESHLGVVCSIDIKMGGADIRMISVYVPPDRSCISHAHFENIQSTPESDSEPISTLDADFRFRGRLTERLQQFTAVHKNGITAADYILTSAQQRIHEHLESPGSSVICLGDFNANGAPQNIQSINGHIGDWVRMMGMLNSTMVLTEHGTCPPTFYRQGTGVSDIDHILFSRDRGLLPIGWRVLDESLWLMLSNHCPLVIDFEAPQFTAVYVSRRKRRRRDKKGRPDIVRFSDGANLSVGQCRDIDRYQKYMRRLHQRPEEDTQGRLLSIMKTSRSALLSVSRRRRKQSLWSPEMVALTANLIAITEMGRYLDGLKGRPRWKEQSHITSGMTILLRNWESQISRMAQSDKTSEKTSTLHWLNFSTRGPDYWRSTSWERAELMVHVIREKRRVSKLISERNRQEWYEMAGERATRRQQTRQHGKHLRELRQLLGTGHTSFSLDYLIDEDRLLVDPKEIHCRVTDHFYDWFKTGNQSWGFHTPDNDFARLWKDKDYFIDKHSTSSIPTHLLEIIWTAMQTPSHRPVEDEESIELLLRASPTLDEFREAIRSSPTDSAGGPLDVTYNAMASWEDNVVEEVYMLLCKLWEDKTVPRFWKWRWLVPIPKVQDNVTLNDLRPLMLTDVTRKIWISIVILKIQNYWRQHGLLSEAQHGFLECKSTEGALLQFRNVLEEARESCTDVFLSSWDVRRAFDRVPKQLLVLGWMRLGVPQDIAEYLVSIDVEGLTMVRTPLAQHTWDKQGTAGFVDLTRDMEGRLPSFTTETGTGQGNIDSPLNWTAIMDILLRALEEADSHPFYVRTCSGMGTGVKLARDIAYADDLISLTSRLEGLQNKADVVCAFCLIFGLEIAVTKLRAYKVHWGGEHTDTLGLSSTEEGCGNAHFISIHISDWKLRRVKVSSFENAPPIKYLGVLFDLNNQDISLKEWVVTTARNLIARLYDRAIDPDLKLDAILYAIFPKILYSSQFASWSLHEYQSIDDIFSAYFRQFLGLRRTFPAELLYASEARGGIGLQRFSNEAQVRKLAVLFRGFQSDHDTKQAAVSLLHRGLRLQNKNPAYTQYAALSTKCIRKQAIFIRSITEWLNKAELQIAKGGQAFHNCSFTHVEDYLLEQGSMLTEEQLGTLEAYGICSIGDIVSTGLLEDGATFRRGRSRAKFLATQEAHELIGRSVRKEFPAFGTFDGVVISYDHPWYRVRYNDGDIEDITATDLRNILVDEIAPEERSLRWLQFPEGPLAFLTNLLPLTPPAISAILLMRNQCYTSNNAHYSMDKGWVWEILGIDKDRVNIRLWQVQIGTVTRCPRQGDQATLMSPSLGAATKVWLPIIDMFGDPKDNNTFRVIMGPDQNSRKIRRCIAYIYKQPPWMIDMPEMDVPLLRSLFEEIPYLRDTQCFTDGSLVQDTNPIVEALVLPSQTLPYRQMGNAPISSGSLVARRMGTEAFEPSEVVIRVIHGEEVRCSNSFDIELILLTLGCVLRWMAAVFASPCVRIDLFSDCKSAIDKANLTDVQAIRHNGHRSHGLLLRQIHSSRYSNDLKVSHVYGHPERRLLRGETWRHLTGTDAGIYLADKAASTTFSDIECKRPPLVTRAKDVLLMMRCLEDCVIVTKEGLPILEDPLELVQHSQFMSYLQQRDSRRNIKRWTAYIREAPGVFLPSNKKYTIRARRTKLFFNWYLREEQTHKGDERILCPLCGQDIQGDKERHLYLSCGDVEIENIRLETIDKLRTKVYGDATTPQPLQCVLAKLYQLLTNSLDRHLLWKGHVSCALWEQLMETLPHYNTLDKTISRQIIISIREMLLLTGTAVTEMRRSYWKNGTTQRLPPNSSPPTMAQAEYLRHIKQTRLPAVWGIMTPAEQIDWEIKRRLGRKSKQLPPALPAKRQTSLRPYLTKYATEALQLIPSVIVVNELYKRKDTG